MAKKKDDDVYENETPQYWEQYALFGMSIRGKLRVPRTLRMQGVVPEPELIQVRGDGTKKRTTKLDETKKKLTVYTITNPEGKVYVGKTQYPGMRYSNHCSQAIHFEKWVGKGLLQEGKYTVADLRWEILSGHLDNTPPEGKKQLLKGLERLIYDTYHAAGLAVNKRRP